MGESVKQFLARIGASGGRSTSPKKVRAARQNVAKATRARLAKKRAKKGGAK